MLLFLVAGAFIASVLATFTTSTPALATLLLVFFFESAIFPTIFAMCLRGLGARTKLGSAFLTMAISGGSVVPAIQYGVEHGGKSIQYSLVVAVALFAFCGVLPIWVNTFPVARTQVDPLVEGEQSTRVSWGVGKKIGGLVKKKKRLDLPTVEHVEEAG
jgi:fucose permease